jgi:hypothetical protein
MREVKLYDTPASWLQIIRLDEFALFHCDIKSGTLTDAGGGFSPSGEEVCAIFSNLQAAESYCSAKVLELPFPRCEI